MLDGISGTNDSDILQSFDRTDKFLLHILRKAGRNAVGIIFIRVEAFRFQENLMTLFVGEFL